MKRIGLFGGTFDPPHHGHVHIARAFADELQLESVIFIPAGLPYHKSIYSDTTNAQRLAMVERVMTLDDRFSVSDCDLLRKGPTYTFDTVAQFREVFPQKQLWWLVGMDSLQQLPKWYRYQALLENTNFAIAARGEIGLDAMPQELQGWLPNALAKSRSEIDGNDGGRAYVLQAAYLPISSTSIRSHWSRGNYDGVPATVVEYIDQEGLYRA
jgi:nicotinate-nucleotide adenylyltransferase